MKRLAGVLAAVLIAVSCGGGHEDDGLSKTTLTKLEATDLKVGDGSRGPTGTPGRRALHRLALSPDETGPQRPQVRQLTRSQSAVRPDARSRARSFPGWDQGLLGMKAGGERRLVIPPGLAYGSSGHGDIPPDATLVFDVELMGVQ